MWPAFRSKAPGTNTTNAPHAAPHAAIRLAHNTMHVASGYKCIHYGSFFMGRVQVCVQAKGHKVNDYHKQNSRSATSQQESSCVAPAGLYTITRRDLLKQLCLAGGFLLMPAGPAPAAQPAASKSSPGEADDETGPLVCPTQLDNQVVDALMQAVYDTLEKLQVMDVSVFRQEVEQLQQRELPYYQQSNKQRPAATASTGAPELATEQLSPQQLFNFQYYIVWKVVAKHVQGAEARTKFNQAVGNSMLWQLWPDGIQQAEAAAQITGIGGRASESQLVALLRGLLDILVQGGYCCRYQIVWGELPGGWPQDWMTTQPALDGLQPSEDAPLPPGFSFQVKLHLPADIEGSVALRSEEEGFWSRAVSSMVLQLFAYAGYTSLGPNVVQEFFYQDQWVGPKSVTDKILLGLGDPLETVGIDFFPTTLVQDWELP